jgi:GAF domain-containing protein
MPNGLRSEKHLPNENKKRSGAELLRTLLYISIATAVVALVLTILGGEGWKTLLPLSALLIASVISLILDYRGMSLPGRILLPSALFIVITVVVTTGFGIHDSDLIAYGGVIIIASLTLGANAAIVFAGLIIASIFAIGFGEIRGILVSRTSSITDLIVLFNISSVVLAIGAIQRAFVNRLNDSIKQARENEEKQIQANKALEEERANLEVRVRERTNELERRVIQLHAAAEIGSTMASLHNLESLLSQTARLVYLRFGFYHTGIFLLDDTGRFAVLRAAESEGGQIMQARGYQVQVGEKGVISEVAQTGQTRIAFDTGRNPIRFDNPQLPDTRSEIALPLKVGKKIIGVLDVHSAQEAAFTDDDAATLQIVADQLSVAIENIRLLAESQVVAETAQRAYGEFAVQAWKNRFKTKPSQGFRSVGRGNTISVADNAEWPQLALQSTRDGKAVASTDGKTLYVPLLVRGQAIGFMKLEKPNQERWSALEKEAAQSLADQLSGALDSARLYDESQKQALKEKIISDASAHISSALNIENILQVTVEELNKSLGSSEIVLQLSSDKSD